MKAIRILASLLLMTATSATYGAQLLVLNKSDSTLSFIDLVSGKTTATIPTGEGPHEIELSSDGKLAFVSNYGSSRAGNTLSVIDVENRTELTRVDLKDLLRPHGLSVSKGFVYFTAEDSRRVGRYDPKKQAVDWTFDTTQERTHMILASRDGSKLFTSNMGSNSIGVIEQTAGNTWKQTLIFVGKGPEALDESPDGRELWTAHSADGGISIIDPTDKKVIHSFDAKTQRSNRLKFTPDGRYVLVSDLSGGELVVIDAVRRSERARLKVGRTPTGVLVEPDGRHAYVAVSGENRIGVLDLKTMTVIKTILTGNGPDGMAWIR